MTSHFKHDHGAGAGIATARGPAQIAEIAQGGLYARYAKRGLDITGAVLLGLVFAPLILVLLLVVTRDGGPAIFGHRRVGRDGQMFRCLKFRTMVTDAEERLNRLLVSDRRAAEQWAADRKLDPDPRITPIGRFLRASSLDELPQLWNVLRGEMSLVGPRPVTLDELARYGEARAVYLALRPGLTGKWQVSGRNDVSYDSRIALDVEYASRISLTEDLSILMKTVGVVLAKTGK